MPRLRYRRKRKPRKLFEIERPERLEDKAIIAQYMIMHDSVCDAVYQYYESKQLKLESIDKPYYIIFRKVITYYRKYNEAPKRTLRLLLEKEIQREDSGMANFLEGISREYEANRTAYKILPQYIIDTVLPRFIKQNQINFALDTIDKKLKENDHKEAERVILEYKQFHEQSEDIVKIADPSTYEYYTELFDRQSSSGQSVFEYSQYVGDIRYIFGKLNRGWLVSLSGSTKSGKSALLLDIAIRASIEQNRKVMMFQPEMTEDDLIMERFLPWLIEKPLDKIHPSRNFEYIPNIDCLHNQLGTCPYRYKSREPRSKNKTILTREIASQSGRKVSYSEIGADERKARTWRTCSTCRERRLKYYIPSVHLTRLKIGKAINEYSDYYKQILVKQALRDFIKPKYRQNLKIKFVPKYSTTLEECISFAESYEKKFNWKADIFIFDYLDILGIGKNIEDKQRHQQVDHIWKKASAFAQEKNALVITAEQTTKAGREFRLLDQTVTPEAAAKDHHVDKKFGVVKIADETRNNICRVNCIYDRHSPFDRNTEVLITQHLTYGQALKDSVFWKNKHMPPYPVKIPE